jgi:hypothetical protein
MPTFLRAEGQWRDNLQPFVGIDGTFREAESLWARRGTEWVRVWSKIPAAVGALGLASNPNFASITIAWASVPTALSYNVYQNGVKVASVTSPSVTRSGLVRNTAYTYYVRAVNAAGAEGPSSPSYRYFTGRDEARDTGTVAFYVNCVVSGSWRADTGWFYTGDDVRQGYYSSPYGGTGYYGVFDYGNLSGVIAANCGGGTIGNNRLANGSARAASVYMTKKGGVGTSGAVVVSFFASNAVVGSSGRPGFVTSRHDVTSTSSGAGKWYPLRSDMVGAMTGAARSLCIYNDWNPRGYYAAFNGAGNGSGPDGDLYIEWTWNYVTQGALPPTWGPA